MVDTPGPHDDCSCRHCGRPSPGHDGRCEDRREADRLEREVRRLRAEREQLEQLAVRAERAERRAARAEREIRQQLVQAVRGRGLWRLGPVALAAELDGIRASFVANGMAPERALLWCAELEALARGHAAAVRAGRGGRR